MAIYSKGSRPYRGPYSPDFKGDDVGNYQSGTGELNSYDPTNSVADLRAGRPTVKNFDGRGIDISGQIDPQTPYGFAFDDNKDTNWSRDKSDAGIGGNSGPISVNPNNHPRRGKVRKDTSGGY
jgi:hypothetical protein